MLFNITRIRLKHCGLCVVKLYFVVDRKKSTELGIFAWIMLCRLVAKSEETRIEKYVASFSRVYCVSLLVFVLHATSERLSTVKGSHR